MGSYKKCAEIKRAREGPAKILFLFIKYAKFAVLSLPSRRMATAIPMKTSFEKKHLRSCDYFAVIPPSLNFTVLMKYATTVPQV